METFRPRPKFLSAEPEEVRKVRGILLKITKANYIKLIDECLNINVLSDIDNDSFKETMETALVDEKLMAQIVKVLITQIKFSSKADKSLKSESSDYQSELAEDIILIYSNLATDLRDKWRKRQGRIFYHCLLKEVVKYFNEYYCAEDYDALECNAMIRFVSYLCMSEKKVLPVLFALKICEKFDRICNKDVTLRIKFFTALIKKFRENIVFKTEYEEKYFDFFTKIVNKEEGYGVHSSIVFKCKDDVLSRW